MSSIVNTNELFEDFIEGDDVYNSIFEELDFPSGKCQEAETSIPSFNCLGEVSVKEIKFSLSSFYYSNYGPHTIYCQSKCDRGKIESICLFEKAWDKGTCLFSYMDELFKSASMELMILDEASIIHCGSLIPDSCDETKRNYYQIRQDFIKLFLFSNDFLSRLLNYPEYHWALRGMVDKFTKKLSSLRKQLGRVTQLPEYIFQFCAHSSGNKCEEAGYHVVHCRLDLHWLDLHLASILQRASSISQVPHLQNVYLPLVKELFDLSLVRFSKLDHRDLTKKSPFNCTCVQEIWLMLQIVIDLDSKISCEKRFWSLFENLLLSFLKLRSFGFIDNMDCSSFRLDSSSFSHATSCLYALWFVYNVGKLYKFDGKEAISYYPLLETIMKHLMSEEISEQELRNCLYFVEKICLDMWEPKTEPLLILWEYYQKRLNSLFYISGQDLDSVAVIGRSALGLISQVKERLDDLYSIKNSFEHFLRIVGLHLKRCCGSQNQRHWNLMTGRIYSKLTPPKLLTLNQTGEYHCVSLFLTLAVSSDINQVVNKFNDLCDAYIVSRGSLGKELLKGQLALCLFSVERGDSITKLVPSITRSLSKADLDHCRELFSTTIDAFSDILDHHNSLSLGQHLFIDSWIGKYLSSCSQTEALKLLDVILSFVVKIKEQVEIDPCKELEDMMDRVWSQLGGYLMSSTCSSYVILADIAANLASIYFVLSNSSRFSNIVSLFSSNQSSDVRLVQRFISQLLENDRMKCVLKDLDSLIIETWLRSNLVLMEVDNFELKTLGKVMFNLPGIRQIIVDNCDIFSSDDPLLEFFTAIHTKYQSLEIESDRMRLSNKISSYLKDLDKWIKPVIISCQSAQQIYKLYFSVGSALSLISHLIYIKSKPNGLIQSVISLMLLPISAHNAEVKIHPHILSAVRKTLHLFLQGLSNLGPSSDAYIGRSVKELISVYIPRCLSNTGPLPSQHHISSFSLVSLFNEFDSSLTSLILQNISLIFFKPKARNPLPNAIHAVRFIKELLLLHSTSTDVLICISNHSMESICDIIMYCDNKTSVYMMSKDILRLFFENNLLKLNKILSDRVNHLLSQLCTSNLAWSSRQLFDLLYLLCSYIPTLMKLFLPNLLQHIKLIETKRGVSHDKVLRLGFERIQTRVSSTK